MEDREMAEIDLVFMISQSSLVIKILVTILAVMSVISWALIFFKWFQLNKTAKRVAACLLRLNEGQDLRGVVLPIGKDAESPCRRVAVEGLQELSRLKKLDKLSREEVESTMQSLRDLLNQEVSAQVERFFGSLSFLATCVNVAPFLGLFGTVWGIMHSFYVIGLMKNATLEAVAPGLSEALVTTALGLAVAIPASVAYNFLTRVLGGIHRDLSKFTHIFLNRIRREILIPRLEKASTTHPVHHQSNELGQAEIH
jgi:biopolymer transport protein TolQ